MDEIQSLRTGQNEGVHKRGERSSPRSGGELAEPRKKVMTMSQATQQDQGVFRDYLEVQDALQNNILKNV